MASMHRKNSLVEVMYTDLVTAHMFNLYRFLIRNSVPFPYRCTLGPQRLPQKARRGKHCRDRRA